MADLRVSQNYLEVVSLAANQLRVSQNFLEIVSLATAELRVSHNYIEIIYLPNVQIVADNLNFPWVDSVSTSIVSPVTPLTITVSDTFNFLDSITNTVAAIGFLGVYIGDGGFNKVFIGSNLVFLGTDSSTLTLSDFSGLVYGYSKAASDSFSLSDSIATASNNIALAFFDSIQLLDSLSTTNIERLVLSILDSFTLTDSNNFNPVILSNPREIRNNGNNDLVGTCLVVFKDYSAGSETVPGTCIVVFKDYSAGLESAPGSCTTDFYNVIP